MNLTTNPFAEMAGQLRAGETQVRGQIQRDLEPCLLRILTRAVTSAGPASPLDRRIMALARRIHPGPVTSDAGRRQAAHAVCAWIVNRMAPADTGAVDYLATLMC